MSDLYFISDIAGDCLLTRDFLWRRRAHATPEELADDDGDLWAFHSQHDAQMFCNGYRAVGFAVPCQVS